MPRRIEDKQALLDYINKRPSKKKKMAITFSIIAVFLALAIFIWIQIHKTNEFNRQVDAAKDALRNEDYKTSVTIYNKIIKEDDDNAEFYEGRADAYMGLKKYNKAIKDYHRAIDNDQSNEKLYKKGVKAGMKTGNNRKAMKFINEMKTNVGEKQSEKLRKQTFVYPAQRALKKLLRELKESAKTTKDTYAMKLEAYTYFDLDGDGIDELLAESGRTINKEKNFKIYAYRKGSVKTMLDKSEYGVVSVKVYDKTRCMELLCRGNGNETYTYYKIKVNSCSRRVSSTRRAAVAGAYSDGQWTYFGVSDGEVIGKTAYEKTTAKMTKGKARTTEKSKWRSDI